MTACGVTARRHPGGRVRAALSFPVLALSLALGGCATPDLCQRYAKDKRFDDAIRACSAQIDGPGFSSHIEQALNRRGNAYSAKGDYDPAIADYSHAIEIKPQFALPYSNRALTLIRKGEFERALADLDKALDLFPGHARSYLHSGKAYALKGELDKAVADYSRGIELDPSYGAYLGRGTLFAVQQKWPEAVADFRKAIEVAPNNEYGYLNLLAATWRSGGDPADALKHLAELVSRHESDKWIRIVSRYYLGSQGVGEREVLEESGKGKTGKETRERLCEAYYYLGLKRLVSGNREGAEDFFRKCLDTWYSVTPSIWGRLIWSTGNEKA
jgi:tetratricopeptide (TPR) repeat protein